MKFFSDNINPTFLQKWSCLGEVSNSVGDTLRHTPWPHVFSREGCQGHHVVPRFVGSPFPTCRSRRYLIYRHRLPPSIRYHFLFRTGHGPSCLSWNHSPSLVFVPFVRSISLVVLVPVSPADQNKVETPVRNSLFRTVHVPLYTDRHLWSWLFSHN